MKLSTNGATKPKANRLPKTAPAKELHPDEADILYQESLDRFKAGQPQRMPKILPLWMVMSLGLHRTKYNAKHQDYGVRGGLISIEFHDHDKVYELMEAVPEGFDIVMHPESEVYYIGPTDEIQKLRALVDEYRKGISQQCLLLGRINSTVFWDFDKQDHDCDD